MRSGAGVRGLRRLSSVPDQVSLLRRAAASAWWVSTDDVDAVLHELGAHRLGQPDERELARRVRCEVRHRDPRPAARRARRAGRPGRATRRHRPRGLHVLGPVRARRGGPDAGRVDVGAGRPAAAARRRRRRGLPAADRPADLDPAGEAARRRRRRLRPVRPRSSSRGTRPWSAQTATMTRAPTRAPPMSSCAAARPGPAGQAPGRRWPGRR